MDLSLEPDVVFEPLPTLAELPVTFG